MLIAVNFHYIRPAYTAKYDGIHGVTLEEFERQVRVLGRLGTFVSYEQILDAVRGRSSLPDKAIVVTFDDGLREQYDHAVPVLRRFGIPAIFFVNTRPITEKIVLTVHKIHLLRSSVPPPAFIEMLHRHARAQAIEMCRGVDPLRAQAQYPFDTPEAAHVKSLLNFVLRPGEREALIDACFHEFFGADESSMAESLYMGVNEIRQLARWSSLGSHAHDHVPLGMLQAKESQELIDLSLRHLEEWTGCRPAALSYPYGSRDACSTAVAEVAARSGLEFAFTMERAANNGASFTAPLLLGRFDCNDVPGGKCPQSIAAEFFDRVPTCSWFVNHK